MTIHTTTHTVPPPSANHAGPAAASGPYARVYGVHTLQDAYQPRAPMRYLVEGMIAAPSLNMFYGSPGTLKSMILLDMSIAVAAGQPWLEPLPLVSSTSVTAVPVQQAPVLWLDLDNGKRRSEERIEAVAKTRQLPATAPFYYVSMPEPWPDASNRYMCKIIVQVILELGALLVVIDNLGQVLGDTEENTASMAKVMGNFRHMAEEAGAAFVLLHHQRKGTGPGTRKGEMLRGHSSIEASLDLAVCVERESDKPELALIPTKVRDFDVPTLGAYFSYTHKMGTKELESALFYGQEVETPDKKMHRRVADAIVAELQAIKTNGDPAPNKGQLTQAVRERLALWNIAVGVNKVRGLIAELVRQKTIVERTGASNTRTYSTP